MGDTNIGQNAYIDEFGQINKSSSSNFCTHCGCRLPLSAKYCPECGQQLHHSAKIIHEEVNYTETCNQSQTIESNRTKEKEWPWYVWFAIYLPSCFLVTYIINEFCFDNPMSLLTICIVSFISAIFGTITSL